MKLSNSQFIELKDELRALIYAQTRLLDFLIHNLIKVSELSEEQAYIAETIKMMLQSIGVSMHSILKLTEDIDMAIKDCFGIARTISEMSINVAYITVSDVGVAHRAQAHALQKTFRDFCRTAENSEFKLELSSTNIPNPKDIDGLQEALELFTNKKGREIRAWSPKSLEQRIEAICDFNKNAGLNLTVSKFSIYRHSSELLHGSYFGVKYFWASPTGDKLDRAGFEETWVLSHLMTVFNAVFFGAAGVIETCAQKFAITDLNDSLDELFARTKEIMTPFEDTSSAKNK
jgi:hypothetical protein